MQNNKKDEEDISAYYPDGDAENMEKDDLQEEFYSKNQKKKNKIKKKNARLTKSQVALIAVIFVVYTAIIFTAAWLIFYKPAQNTNKELPFETEPAETHDEENPPLDGNKTTDKTKDNNAVIKDEYTEKKGVYNILVVGHDNEASLADVTMIVNVNEKDKSITVMQFPRDTLITGDYAPITNQINNAFNTFFNNAYRSGDSDPYMTAVKKYEEMLEKSLCINIQFSVLMGLDGFRGIVDAMDGVDVYVPADMYYSDPEQNLYISIPAGYQHLNGANAEGFVRFRSGYVQADLGRVNAQKIFLTAMFNKVKATVKSTNVSALTNIANEVFKCVDTDMSVSDIIYFAKLFLNIDLSNINMMTVPGNMAGRFYVVNRASTLKVINEYYNIYNKEISDSIFDKNYLFCYTDLQYISDVYFDTSDSIFDGVHNAEDIDDESIYIPRT